MTCRQANLEPAKTIEELQHKLDDLNAHIAALRDLVWEEDIPSPTIPEYVEHHESIQKILKYIDAKLISKGVTI